MKQLNVSTMGARKAIQAYIFEASNAELEEILNTINVDWYEVKYTVTDYGELADDVKALEMLGGR